MKLLEILKKERERKLCIWKKSQLDKSSTFQDVYKAMKEGYNQDLIKCLSCTGNEKNYKCYYPLYKIKTDERR